MRHRTIAPAVIWSVAIAVIVGLGVGWWSIVRPPRDGGSTAMSVTIGGPFSLVDQERRPFTEKDLVGRPTAMFFGYTFCPDVCPTTLLEASQWLAALGADAERFRVVFVTVDPERDTPEKLGEFAASFDPQIVALSGPRPEIDRVVRAYRVYARKVDGKDGVYTMDHTAAVYLLDRAGRFSGMIEFQEETAKALAKIRALIAAP
jgi:protein SCO1/2